MAQSVASLFNLALSAVGNNITVSDPDEQSPEGEMCRLWYEPARDFIFASANWDECKQFQRLALVSQQADDATWVDGLPQPGYLYAYQRPVDCVRPRFLSDYQPFTLGVINENPVLYTNAETPILCYSRSVANVSVWSVNLYMAVAYSLAAHMALQMTGKEARAREIAQKADSIIMTARLNEANQTVVLEQQLASWHQARGFGVYSDNVRFTYPVGNLLTQTIGSLA
jgi:hypothetical protein